MSTYIRGLVALGSVVVLGLLTAGCYTQFGSVQDDRSEGAVGQEQYAYGDSTTVDDYEYARRQFYYDYYYPSAMIGVGFGWPWHGGYYSPYGYGYYSPWVDPWYGWCGSTYPGYYGYWGNPYWGYGSYYGHGGAYYPGGGGYVAAGSTPYGATRTFGSTRSSGSTRGTEVLPIGARSSTPVGKTGSGQLPPGRVSTGRRGQDGERQSVTGTRSGGQRPGSTAGNTSGRRESSRREAPRWYPRPSVSEGSHVSPPVMAPQGGGSAGRESGRGGGERSGGGSTYSSPPPSGNSGGSASANTGSRGGNHR